MRNIEEANFKINTINLLYSEHTWKLCELTTEDMVNNGLIIASAINNGDRLIFCIILKDKLIQSNLLVKAPNFLYFYESLEDKRARAYRINLNSYEIDFTNEIDCVSEPVLIANGLIAFPFETTKENNLRFMNYKGVELDLPSVNNFDLGQFMTGFNFNDCNIEEYDIQSFDENINIGITTDALNFGEKRESLDLYKIYKDEQIIKEWKKIDAHNLHISYDSVDRTKINDKVKWLGIMHNNKADIPNYYYNVTIKILRKENTKFNIGLSKIERIIRLDFNERNANESEKAQYNFLIDSLTNENMPIIEFPNEEHSINIVKSAVYLHCGCKKIGNYCIEVDNSGNLRSSVFYKSGILMHIKRMNKYMNYTDKEIDTLVNNITADTEYRQKLTNRLIKIYEKQKKKENKTRIVSKHFRGEVSRLCRQLGNLKRELYLENMIKTHSIKE